MSTGTALVHPSTAKLTPDAQAKGNYHYTPPEVLGYNRGEALSDEDLRIVRQYYGGVLPVQPSKEALERVRNEPSGGFDYQPQTAPRRVLTKKRAEPARPTPLDAAYTLADSLDDDAAYSLLCRLAGRFNFDIE